jgi:hypothetical protein
MMTSIMTAPPGPAEVLDRDYAFYELLAKIPGYGEPYPGGRYRDQTSITLIR